MLLISQVCKLNNNWSEIDILICLETSCNLTKRKVNKFNTLTWLKIGHNLPKKKIEAK